MAIMFIMKFGLLLAVGEQLTCRRETGIALL